MPAIFEFTNYRNYLETWIESHGERAHGLKGRIATALNVSSSFISQMLKGEKSLTSDQTSNLCDHLGLNDFESDFLHLLVELDRAGDHRYKEKLRRKIATAQQQARGVGKRVPRQKELTDQQRAIYYSSWLYTGIRNLSSVSGFDRADTMADYLKLEPAVVLRVLRFLVDCGLVQETDGKYAYQSGSTHVDRESPFVNKHHQNWRFQAIQKMENRRSDDLYFTSPMSLSRDAAEEIRRMLPNFVQDVMKIATPSAAERVACFNLDWFEY